MRKWPIAADNENQGCSHYPTVSPSSSELVSLFSLPARPDVQARSFFYVLGPPSRLRRSLRLLFPFPPLLSIVITPPSIHLESPSLNRQTPSYLLSSLSFSSLPASSHVLTTVTPWTLIALFSQFSGPRSILPGDSIYILSANANTTVDLSPVSASTKPSPQTHESPFDTICLFTSSTNPTYTSCPLHCIALPSLRLYCNWSRTTLLYPFVFATSIHSLFAISHYIEPRVIPAIHLRYRRITHTRAIVSRSILHHSISGDTGTRARTSTDYIVSKGKTQAYFRLCVEKPAWPGLVHHDCHITSLLHQARNGLQC